MNKKVIVIVALVGTQNAQAGWFEMLSKVPGMGKLLSTIFVVSQGKRKSILPATSALTVPYTPSKKEKKITSEQLPQYEVEATNANWLKIETHVAGNVSLEKYNGSKIIVMPTVRGVAEEFGNIKYTLNRSPENSKQFILQSEDTNTQVKSTLSWLGAVLFWRKQKTEPVLTSNSLDFIVKIPLYFNQLTYDSDIKGNFTFLNAPSAKKETPYVCICNLKGNGGDININHFEGTLDARTADGSIKATNIVGILELEATQGDNITVKNWQLDTYTTKQTKNKFTGKGNIAIELPNNVTVAIDKSTNIFYEGTRYSAGNHMPFVKGAGTHKISISTPRSINLD